MHKTLFIFLFFSSTLVLAQPYTVVEEVLAVVGNEILLQSEVENEILQYSLDKEKIDENTKCDVLNQLIIQKLLIDKAKLDSITVGDDRVAGEIERRIRFFAAQAGGIERLEDYLEKSIDAYKEEIKPKIKEQLLMQQVRETILSDVKISPTEVRTFYNNLPKDSIPLFEGEVELAELRITPTASKASKQYAYKKIEDIRQEIINGDISFEIAATLYSHDNGTKDEGGELGFFSYGQMVPEFEAAAFKLKDNVGISPIIETDYGYHILQLIERRGKNINVRHILIRPAVVQSDLDSASQLLQTISQQVRSNQLNWCDAVKKYTTDKESIGHCGFFTDPSLGSENVPLSYLEKEVLLATENMKPGDISQPFFFLQPDGNKSYRIFYLKSETEPHRANLIDDWQRIQSLALDNKKQTALLDWAKKYRKKTFVRIDEKYTNCPSIGQWIETQE